MLQATKCGDEVEHGKPAPDCFHATAAKIGVAAEDCLVVEDAPAGVQAATAAGMRVVVVPSIRDKEAYPKPDPKAAAGSCLMPATIHCNSGGARLNCVVQDLSRDHRFTLQQTAPTSAGHGQTCRFHISCKIYLEHLPAGAHKRG